MKIKGILSGSFLSKSAFLNRLPVIGWIVLLTILYIANGFRMQQLHRERIRLEKEIAALEVTAVTVRSIRMSITRESYILQQIASRNIDLIEPVNPPRIIIHE